MEAAAVVCRGGLLARAQPGGGARARARARRHGVGAGPAVSVARRRLLVASVGEPLSAPSPNAVAVAQEETCYSSLEFLVSLFSGFVAGCKLPRFRLITQLSVMISVDLVQAAQVDEGVASTEILPPHDVHVKFVLQKQCAFGQKFLVVGDDPALGLWDPTKATALDWSEDHVWTVKKDLPANKLIEFKFLLQDPSGQVRWQHGPNRTLQITETSNTLVIYEDWDYAKNQKVSEEVELSTGAEDVIFSGSNGSLLADELQTDENQETNKSVTTVSVDGETSAVAADASLHREKMGANEANQPELTLDKDKIPDELHVKANMVAQNGNPATIAAADYAGRNGGDTVLHEVGAQVESRPARIFENDMAWARKALQQLFRSLGFQNWHNKNMK